MQPQSRLNEKILDRIPSDKNLLLSPVTNRSLRVFVLSNDIVLLDASAIDVRTLASGICDAVPNSKVVAELRPIASRFRTTD